MSLIHVKSDEQYAKVMKENEAKTMVLDYDMKDCGFCEDMEPIFDELSKKYTDLVFVKISCDECKGPETGGSVQGCPTYRLFKNGKELQEIVGSDEEALREMVAKYSEKK